MQNRFGLKDLFLFGLVLAIGVTLWLSMVQKDRQWEQTQQLSAKLDELGQQVRRQDSGDLTRDVASIKTSVGKVESAVADLQARVAAGVRVADGAASPAARPAAAASASDRDESWARPGVPVEWQPAWTFSTDPRTADGFNEGGEFTEIYEVQLATVVPYIQTDVYGRRIVDMVCESLGVYDANTLKFRGQLAVAWQVDPMGLWLRAKINPRARFSDGKPVTAEDLRWTFHDYLMNQQIDAERTRSITRDIIVKVEALSEHVVEFTFKAAFFSNLDTALTLHVLPKHFYSQFSPAELNKGTGLIMGSGPFRMERLDKDRQWTPPEDLMLVRNENYWGSKPALDRIRIRCMDNELARVTAFRNGDADMVTPSAPQFRTLSADAEFLKDNHAVEWTNMRSGNSFIAWQCGPRAGGKLTPFHDRRVRLAMTHLIDREKMVRDIWRGLGQVSKGNFNPSSPASDPAAKPWPYDLDRAKELLKEAGWEDRDGNGVIEDKDGNEFEFEFTYSGGGEIAERIATFIKDASAAAGIRCTLRPIDWAVGEDIRKRRDFDAITLAWGANAPESDPKQIFHSESIQNQGDNFGQWSNPEADRLIEAGRRELDFEKRMKIWHEFGRVMHEDQPYTWVRIQAYPRFYKQTIGNVRTYPKGLETWEFFRSTSALPMSGN